MDDSTIGATNDQLSKATGGRFTELGTTGLALTGGFVHEEFLRQLQGEKGRRVMREMAENDPVIGGLLFSISMLTRQVEWRVEPAEPATVEEIVSQRQHERALGIAAAKNAKTQREAMASQLPQPPGGPGAAGKPAGPPGTQVAKALISMGVDPTPHAEALERLDRVSRDLRESYLRRLAKATEMGDDPGKAAGDKAGPGSKTQPGAPPKIAPTPEIPQVTAEDVEAEAAIAGEEHAVFVETCLHDMDSPWDEILSEIMSMLTYGWHWAEVVYKKRGGRTGNARTHSKFDDGKLGWRKWGPRAQETTYRWDVDPSDGSIKGMFQMDPYSGRGTVLIPSNRSLHFRTSSAKNNPEGRSVLRSAYRPWFMKKRIEEIEAIGIERDLAGLPVAYVPYSMMSINATQHETAALEEIKKIIRNIRRDEQEGVVFPMAYDPETGNKLYELQLLSTGGQRQFDTDKTIARYDQRIAMVVLADFMLLGHEKVGSFALGQVKADLFTSALEAWVDSIADVINMHAIPRLMRVNGVDPAMSPALVHGRMTQVDLTALGTFVQALAQAGAPLFPDDNLENWLRDAAGMPARDASDELEA